MSKLVIIGAGSKVFVKKLVGDILYGDNTKIEKIALVDTDKEKLEKMASLAKKMVDQEGSPISIESSNDRKEVLKGADYVAATISVGEEELYQKEMEIADKYGVIQIVADTIGPGGVFKGLRTTPILIDIAKDMEKYCPHAYLFNYTNPMAISMLALFNSTRIRSYGLCHSVQHTAEIIAKYLNLESKQASYNCAGINHMAFFLKYEVDGKDIYPELKKIAEDDQKIEKLAENTDYANVSKLNDKVRFEMLRYFGYFITESPWHLSEYLPYFRKDEKTIKDYGVEKRWNLELRNSRESYFNEIDVLTNSNEKIEINRSGEYLPLIIEGIEKNKTLRCNLNVLNNGLITNLPYNSCVEVPCFVDSSGIYPCFVGDLPEQCAALNRTNVNVHILAAKAIMEKDKGKKKELSKMAIKLDPYTSSIMTLKDIDKMVDELFKLQAEYVYV